MAESIRKRFHTDFIFPAVLFSTTMCFHFELEMLLLWQSRPLLYGGPTQSNSKILKTQDSPAVCFVSQSRIAHQCRKKVGCGRAEVTKVKRVLNNILSS